MLVQTAVQDEITSRAAQLELLLNWWCIILLWVLLFFSLFTFCLCLVYIAGSILGWALTFLGSLLDQLSFLVWKLIYAQQVCIVFFHRSVLDCVQSFALEDLCAWCVMTAKMDLGSVPSVNTFTGWIKGWKLHCNEQAPSIKWNPVIKLN